MKCVTQPYGGLTLESSMTFAKCGLPTDTHSLKRHRQPSSRTQAIRHGAPKTTMMGHNSWKRRRRGTVPNCLRDFPSLLPLTNTARDWMLVIEANTQPVNYLQVHALST